jgi:uncharacterized protein YdeI (BOF family)
MKILGAIIGGLLIMFTLAAAQQAGQTQPGQDVPKFDPKNQEVITATVQEVKDYHCPVTGSLGTHLTVKTTTGGTYEAHLAPAAFLKEFGMNFKQWETVTITGTKVTFDGKPAILARLIKVNNETYMFRDEKGRPLW